MSGNKALTWLACADNQLINLNISDNTTLTELFCSDNQLINLDVSNNTALATLDCPNNRLTSLDMSNNAALKDLNCNANNLTASALNAMFETLPDNQTWKIIHIEDNPGSADCNRNIAEKKKWIVFKLPSETVNNQDVNSAPPPPPTLPPLPVRPPLLPSPNDNGTNNIVGL